VMLVRGIPVSVKNHELHRRSPHSLKSDWCFENALRLPPRTSVTSTAISARARVEYKNFLLQNLDFPRLGRGSPEGGNMRP